jgi:hypothetical protein
VVEFARADRLVDGHQIGQRNHAAILGANEDVADVVRRCAIGVGHLDDHVVLLAVALEAGHLAAAEHGFQRPADGLDLHAGIHRLVAIDDHRQFGLVQLEIGIDVGEARILRHLFENLPVICSSSA